MESKDEDTEKKSRSGMIVGLLRWLGKKRSVEVAWRDGGNTICESMEVVAGWSAAGMAIIGCEWAEWLVADGDRWLRGENSGVFCVCI